MNPQQYSPNNQYSAGGFQPQNPQSDKTKKIYMVVGALLIVSLLLAIFALFSGGGTDKYFIESIGYQREILRINDVAEDYSETLDFNNYRSNVNVLVGSDLSSIQTAYGKEVKAKQTASIGDEQVIVRFEDAAQTNSFEDEYAETMTDTLDRSVQSLQKLKTESPSKHISTIETAIENQKSLIEQLEIL